MNERTMARMMAPAARRIQNMLARGTVALSNAAAKMQTLQVRLLADETLDGIEHFEPYGFTSRPKPGAEVLTLSVDGDRSHTVVIVAADRRFRLEALEEGEVALHDDGSSSIVLKRGGIVEISAGTALRLMAPQIEAISDVFTHNGINIGSTHVHGNVAPGGGATSTPS